MPEGLRRGVDAGDAPEFHREGVAGAGPVQAAGDARAGEAGGPRPPIPPTQDAPTRPPLLSVALPAGLDAHAVGVLADGPARGRVEQVVVGLRRAPNARQVSGEAELQLGKDRAAQRQHALLAALAGHPEPSALRVEVAEANVRELVLA